MSRINKWKLFLPFCSELSISHRLSVRLEVPLSVFGLIRLGFYNPNKPPLPLSSRQASRVHLSLSFYRFYRLSTLSFQRPDLSGWGLYLWEHQNDYNNYHHHRDWLCHYLLSSAPIARTLSSLSSASAPTTSTSTS